MIPGNEKFPIRELRVAGVSGWESCESRNRFKETKLDDSYRFVLPLTLVAALQDEWLEDAMLFRSYFMHYRLIRETITAIATVGAAILFSYLILQA